MSKETHSGLFARIETEISNYIAQGVEVAEGVHFSQHDTVKRIYKFRNKQLSSSKINDDLSYNYYFDIIEPRVDSMVKNLRFDTKHVKLFSTNPIDDFGAVFIANASLKKWMNEKGEDDKLKESVEEFVANGNIGFKKVKGTYEIVDVLNLVVTNQLAKTVHETDLIERHELKASEIKAMKGWDQDVAQRVIKDLGEKSFSATSETTEQSSTSNSYEIYEFTGEVSEKEFYAVKGMEQEGDADTYFLAKIIVAGLEEGGSGEKYTLYAEQLNGDMTDYYEFAHLGKYNGRFWREGLVEKLMDHQIRANQIGNDLASGLEWASKVVFKSNDSRVLQNIRADLDNGDVILAQDLDQLYVRMQGADQLIADWNRLMQDADRISNSFEVVRGESLPAGTPFRLGALIDQNAGMLFTFLRQKITLPYKRIFKNWVLAELIKDLKGEKIFSLVGEIEVMDRLRTIMVEKWYMENLVKIGPHTKEQAEAIKAEKLDELRETDPTIENAPEIWKGVMPRLFVTITGENSDLADQVTDLINLVGLEKDPRRIAWILDQIYGIRNIPIPPQEFNEPSEQQIVSGAGIQKSAPQVQQPIE